MTKIPTVRLVFDRKHVASRERKGLVQIEITHGGKRKWVTANVKLYKDQWDDRRHVIKKTDALDLNDYLNEQVSSLEKWLRDCAPFSWEKLNGYFERANGQTTDFIDYLRNDIESRNDIRASTKRAHRKLVTRLTEYGRITYFSDLTPANVFNFDNWLHGRKVRKLDKNGQETLMPMCQQTIYDYHKLLRIYINRAIKRGVFKGNPYDGWRFPHGKAEPGRYLTDAELTRFEKAEMRSGSIARARDLFVFQCFTGLSYVDLADFDFNKAQDIGDNLLFYSGQRVKTGVTFNFILLPKALEILQKYHYKLPVTTMEAYNRNLKKAAQDANIDKSLSTHWARRTAAMVFVNHGIRMDVVARILGHSSMKTTERFYASLNQQTVVEEMKKAGL